MWLTVLTMMCIITIWTLLFSQALNKGADKQ